MVLLFLLLTSMAWTQKIYAAIGSHGAGMPGMQCVLLGAIPPAIMKGATLHFPWNILALLGKIARAPHRVPSYQWWPAWNNCMHLCKGHALKCLAQLKARLEKFSATPQKLLANRLQSCRRAWNFSQKFFPRISPFGTYFLEFTCFHMYWVLIYMFSDLFGLCWHIRSKFARFKMYIGSYWVYICMFSGGGRVKCFCAIQLSMHCHMKIQSKKC